MAIRKEMTPSVCRNESGVGARRQASGIAGGVWMLVIIFMSSMFGGCSKSESYSDLLRNEEKAVNWYLAGKRVEVSVPADSVFEVGEDAPFYRMDEDGTVYMQVLSTGDMNDRPEEGDRIYFRFQRRNILSMYEGVDAPAVGNMDDFSSNIGSTSFFLGNKIYPTTQQFGTGLQVPMTYLGYYAEVNLVLKSYSGFTSDQTQCIPYVLNVKYYRPEY